VDPRRKHKRKKFKYNQDRDRKRALFDSIEECEEDIGGPFYCDRCHCLWLSFFQEWDYCECHEPKRNAIPFHKLHPEPEVDIPRIRSVRDGKFVYAPLEPPEESEHDDRGLYNREYAGWWWDDPWQIGPPPW